MRKSYFVYTEGLNSYFPIVVTPKRVIPMTTQKTYICKYRYPRKYNGEVRTSRFREGYLAFKIWCKDMPSTMEILWHGYEDKEQEGNKELALPMTKCEKCGAKSYNVAGCPSVMYNAKREKTLCFECVAELMEEDWDKAERESENDILNAAFERG